MAIVAEPDVAPCSGRERTVDSRPRSGSSSIGIRPPQPAQVAKLQRVRRILGEMDDERAVAGRDHVALAEQHPLDPQAVDLRPVGAAQIDQVAEGRLVLDLEMLARQQHGPWSSGKWTREDRPTMNVWRRSITVLLTGVRA